MDDRSCLKERICQAIDSAREEIVALGEAIMDGPELGFKEHATAARTAAAFERLGLSCQQGLAITGLKAALPANRSGPTVALMGELDALVVPGHPRADPVSGAAHACGHNAQIAGLVGAALGLVQAGATQHLAGQVLFFGVPAEEYVEIEYRLGLVRQGRIAFLAGKPELVRLGHFDGVDMAMMVYTLSPDQAEGPVGVAASSNGFLAKSIRFVGRAAHAGGAPEKGTNALNAAMLAISAINAQRETFRDQDCVRVHPIITRGGDLVNIVPADVRLETYVRARSCQAMMDAADKVDRSFRGAALAMGCTLEVETAPGYLPLRNDPELTRLFRGNAEALFGADTFRDYPHSGGSTDAGDLSQIMPVLHPAMAGGAGSVHGPDWRIADPGAAYLAPAKALAMTIVDLLWDDAAAALRVLAQSRPAMTRDEYVQQQQGLFRHEVYHGGDTGAAQARGGDL